MTTSIGTLTVLQGGSQDEDLQDLQESKEGLREFIITFLKEHSNGITLEMLEGNPAYINFLADCELAYQTHVKKVNDDNVVERRKREAAKQQLLMAAVKDLTVVLREKHGLPMPLTQDQIRALAKTNQEKVLARVQPEPAKPSKPTIAEDKLVSLRRMYGYKLPEFVFDSAVGAVQFRQALKKCIQPYRTKLWDKSLDSRYEAELRKFLKQIQSFFNGADAVVTEGWRLDLQTTGEVLPEFMKILADDERFSWMMAWMGRCPTPEELDIQTEEVQAKKQAAEAEKLAIEAAKQQRREQLAAVLKERMLAVETEYVSAGVKEKLAGDFAKKYGDLPEIEALLGKDSNLSDESAKQLVKVIFTKAAASRMASALKAKENEPEKDNEFEMGIARDYAKFAGITDDQELDTAVSDLRKQSNESGKPQQTNNGGKPVVDKKTKNEANREARATQNRANSRGGRGKGKKKQ